MTTQPISGIDSAQGTVGTCATNYPSRPTTTRKVRSQQTFWHYVSNNMDATFDVATTFNTHPVITSDYGYSILPYNSLGTAWSPGEYYRTFSAAQRVKLLGMGYTVSHFSTLTENITARQSSTVLENVYESKPHAQEWHDHAHVFDSSLCDEHLPSTYSAINIKQFAQINNNMENYEPVSQADGALRRAYWLWQNNSNTNFTTNSQLINIMDYANITARSDGTSWAFKWTNTHPVWMGCGKMANLPWGACSDSQAPDSGGWNKAGYWPKSRSDALVSYYFTNDPLIPTYGSMGAPGVSIAPPIPANTAFPITTAPTIEAQSHAPPYAYIKMAPLHGPLAPINTIAVMLVTYWQEVEIEEVSWISRNPAFTANTNWSGAISGYALQGFYNQRATVGECSTTIGRNNKLDGFEDIRIEDM